MKKELCTAMIIVAGAAAACSREDQTARISPNDHSDDNRNTSLYVDTLSTEFAGESPIISPLAEKERSEEIQNTETTETGNTADIFSTPMYLLEEDYREMKATLFDLNNRDVSNNFQVPEHFPDLVEEYEDIIAAASETHNVNPRLIAAVIATESHGRSETPSEDGARGPMQVMPENFEKGEDPNDPETNINRGTQILSGQLFHTEGIIEPAIAGYNGGPVARWWIGGPQEEYDERRLEYIKVLANYLIENRGLEEEEALRQAAYKAWEVEEYIRRVTNWYYSFPSVTNN